MIQASIKIHRHTFLRIRFKWIEIGIIVLIYVLFLLTPLSSPSQSKQALRYEIDAKRAGITYTSNDALPRGREFKRIDSTYYVGWMLEGTYKFDHAANYIGYKTAAAQLEKAVALMKKDFSTELKTRTNDVMTYINILKYHRDWDYTTFALMQCYTNMEDPAAVWKLLQQCKKINLQDEIFSDTYNYLAWTIHRNRFYTSSTYSFLKNSIDENERFASKLTDSAALKIKRDAELNKTFFGTRYENEKMPSVWHYKSILYTYQLNIESGAYYYEKLRATNYFPANNFATFCAIQAKFKEAETYYTLSKKENPGDKRLNESSYYLSILHQYKNENKKAIEELKNLIKANGSTPGFGWYNLALARALIYDGQTEIAKRYAHTAEQFKEIHIGTTLGQSHYDFTSSLMNLIIKIQEIETVKFLNKGWWYSPQAISKVAKLTIEKYGLQFLIINQFSQNPERDRVIYKIFSTESTVSFDEIWHLLDGFSSTYFLNRFKHELNHDTRVRVKRYYTLFIANILLKKGDYKNAKTYYESILNESTIDAEYEKLFLARVFEGLSSCDQKLGLAKTSNYLARLYAMYPQRIPFSGLKMMMHLRSNEKTEIQQQVVKSLRNAAIEWTSQTGPNIPEVKINFNTSNGVQFVEYTCSLHGKIIIRPQRFSYTLAEDAGQKLSLSIFDIGDDDHQSIK